MSFLLDTNICSAHFRRPGGLAHRFIQYSGRMFLSSIVLGELYTGAFHVDNPAPLLGNIHDLLEDMSLLPFDVECAEQFGRLRGGLLRQGLSVPTVDLMIGATAIVHDLTLVTHNTADFINIPGLRLEDWLRP